MRVIGHLDMDAFFAAVEERDHDWLKGKPIVVGADPKNGKGRGVVSTANYKAREYGIRSAMPISRAWQLSETARRQGKPSAEFLLGNFRRYGEVSEKIFELVKEELLENKILPIVEEASIDEIYFDLSGANSLARAEFFCTSLKIQILKKLHLTCSIGIGPNKLIAKIASDMQKPDGLTVVAAEDAENFLEPLPIRKIPGIGPKTELIFLNLKIKGVKDLKRLSRQKLTELLGKWGIELYDRIRGIDDSPVVEKYEAKSIGEQETFETDSNDASFIFSRLKDLCQGVFLRLKTEGFQKYRTVVITVRYADFQTFSKSKTLERAESSQERLYFEAMRLFLPFISGKNNGKLLRLIGVRVEKLEK